MAIFNLPRNRFLHVLYTNLSVQATFTVLFAYFCSYNTF